MKGSFGNDRSIMAEVAVVRAVFTVGVSRRVGITASDRNVSDRDGGTGTRARLDVIMVFLIISFSNNVCMW